MDTHMLVVLLSHLVITVIRTRKAAREAIMDTVTQAHRLREEIMDTHTQETAVAVVVVIMVILMLVVNVVLLLLPLPIHLVNVILLHESGKHGRVRINSF